MEDRMNCKDVDECSFGVCDWNADCINMPGSFECICKIGYSLEENGIFCQDIDECKISPDVCTDPGSTCVNILGSYRCMCRAGYRPFRPGLCRDINECDWSPCPEKATCQNTHGSYICQCWKGYKWLSGDCFATSFLG